MQKEVIIGDARLLLGDCALILPTLGKVDAVIDRWVEVDGKRFKAYRILKGC